MTTDKPNSSQGDTIIPAYLKRWPGLYMRQNDRIVEALSEDIEIAKSYPSWKDKGTVVKGRRITIMSRKGAYRAGEEVRVIHVLEALDPGQEIFIMGPKAVCGEYVDGHLMTAEPGSEPHVYDGTVLKSPGVDYNYDITTYRFDSPGQHRILWQMGELQSNTLELQIILH